MKLKTEKLRTYARHYPVALGALAAILVCGTLYFVRSGSLPTQRAHLEKLESTLRVIENNRRHSRELTEHVTQAEHLSQTLQSRLYQMGDRTNNLRHWWTLEQSAGIVLQGPPRVIAEPQKPKEGPSFAPARIAFNIQGEYAKILDFVNRAQSTQYMARVVSLQIQPARANNPGIMSAEATFLILATPE